MISDQGLQLSHQNLRKIVLRINLSIMAERGLPCTRVMVKKFTAGNSDFFHAEYEPRSQYWVMFQMHYS